MFRALIAALILSAASLPTFAADNGFYIGASVGQGGVDTESADFGFVTEDFDGDDTGFKVIAGFRPLEWLAIEANYVDLGTASDNVAGVNVDVETKGIESLADGIMERWFTPAFRRPENAAYYGYRTMLTRQSAVGYAATCAALRDADLTESTKRIAVPTLCVVGDQDGSTPPGVVLSMAKLIHGARYEVIKDAGHIPCVEQPEMLTEMIRAFIDTIPTGGKLHA